MHKIGLIVLVILLAPGLFLPFGESQAQVGETWGDVIAVTSFGYGAMLSVDWSAVNGQLAVASERGFQFYNEAMQLQGERRFEELAQGTVLFSPDLQLVARSEAGGLVIRNTRTWQPIFTLVDYAAPSWSPDSRQLAVWAGNTLRVWDVYRAEITREITELISQNVPVQWSPEGDIIALPGPGALLMVGMATGEIVRIHPFAQLSRFDWSADGRWFTIVGLKDPPPPDHDPDIPVMKELIRMDALTGDIVARYDLSSGGRPGSLYGADGFNAISPNGKYLAATLTRWEPPIYNEDDELVEPEEWVRVGMGVWDLESGEPLHDFSDEDRPLAVVGNVAWNPDGSHFASANGSLLTIIEAESGRIVDSTRAYISTTTETHWNDQQQLVAAGGIWDISGDFPAYLGAQPPAEPIQRPDLEFLKPSPFAFDYNMPPYEWKILHVYEDRNLVLTYEIDIEYPGTPEYEDDEPPEERYKIWDIESGTMLEVRVYLDLQTAWLLDLENADIRADGNTQRNVVESTLFIGIGDDEIVNLREYTETPLEITQQERWEYREVWFSPDGSRIFAYETDNTFKTFDPYTGELLYQTVMAQRNSLQWTSDLSMFTVLDNENTVYVYDAYNGDLLLQAYTGNNTPQLLWSPDLNYLAIGGDNRGIILYHVLTRTRLVVLRGHQAEILSMGWNPYCDLALYDTCDYIFASSDYDGRVILWGVPQRERLVQTLPDYPAEPSLARPQPAVDFSELTPLWTYVAPVDQYGKPAVQNIDWEPGVIRVNGDIFYDDALQPLENEDVPRDVYWYRIEDTARQTRIIKDNVGREQTVVLSLSVDRYGTVRDEEDHSTMVNVGRGTVSDAAFNPDATIVYTAENDGGTNEISGWIGETVIYRTQDDTRRSLRWGGGSPGYNQIALSPDGRWLATATIPYYNSGGRGQIWNPVTRERQASLIGHTRTITQLVWHPRDGTIITSSLDGSIRKWDIYGNQLARWNHRVRAPVVQMQWMGSALLASAGEDLYLLSANDLSVIRVYRGIGGAVFVPSPDNTRLLALGYDAVLRVVDFTAGLPVAEERRHTPSLNHIAWHPSGDHLVVARSDGSIVTLDSLTGEVINILRANGPILRSMEWDASGERLLLDPVDEDYIEIIDADTGGNLLTIENHWRRPGVWWSPDGAKIAYGTYPDPNMGVYTATSLVHVHDAHTGELLHQLKLDWDDYIWYWEKKPVTLSWSEAGDRLAAFYGKERLRIWNLNSFEGEILTTRYEMDRYISLGLWDENQFRFWTPNGHGTYVFATDFLSFSWNEGLPSNTLMRPDGLVFLSGGTIIDRATFYPLQQIDGAYADATWHPFCWNSDCPAMLAVSSGYTVTMYGYPRDEEEIEVALTEEDN